ncbi:hypothetical protein F444_19937 [Phytophthora nicotianae P1976]|uniref:Uncharacterized protein n=1 Tax=Phytophthora nicotianae P1976 TaxID=1317066 RepID=A0A080Z670_PHYNI|nr:hypothetical protein F444_19937 [Phytophthora nicotianae P1976]
MAIITSFDTNFQVARLNLKKLKLLSILSICLTLNSTSIQVHTAIIRLRY